jgi:hypothetical protein
LGLGSGFQDERSREASGNGSAAGDHQRVILIWSNGMDGAVVECR